MNLATRASLSAVFLLAAVACGCAGHEHAPAMESSLAPMTSEGDRFDVVVPGNTVVKIIPSRTDLDSVGYAAFRYDLVSGGALRHSGRRQAAEGGVELPPTTGQSFLYVDGVNGQAGQDPATAAKARLQWKSFGDGTWRLRFRGQRRDDLVVTVLFARPDKYASPTSGVRPTAPAAPAPRPAPAPAAPADAPWTPASEPIQVGDARVRLVSAAVGPVSLLNPRGEPARSPDNHLALTFRIENTGTASVVSFKNWEGYNFPVGRDAVRDDNDRAYRLVSFSPLKFPVGRDESGSIPPGKFLTEVLLFEAPPKGVRYVNVELPAKNLGGSGSIRFQIPAGTIKY